MKKVSIGIIIYIFIINFSCSVLAYSTSEYSIEIPSNYNENGENSFTDENGKNINIQITPFEDSGWDNPYSEKYLDKLVDGFNTEIDNYREELKNKLREKNKNYNVGLTEEEIDEYVKSFKVDSIEKKEITTFSKNNYKGFHIVAKYKMGDISTYADQYIVGSGKKIYTLTISCTSLEEINSNKKIVDSFTIKDFQEIKGKSEKLTDKIITTVITTLIVGGVSALIGKNNLNKRNNNLDDEKKQTKKQNINTESRNLEEMVETNEVKSERVNNLDNEFLEEKERIKNEKEIINEETKKEEKKFCTKCGKHIENDWKFCNYCGNKLK